MGKKKKAFAEICLYGARHVGYGYLAVGPAELAGGKPTSSGRMYGDGEPAAHRSLNDAFWLALSDLEEAGLPRGSDVVVYMPGGERRAFLVSGLGIRPYFGELCWEPAPPALVLTFADVKRAG